MEATVNNVMNETTADGKTVYSRAALVIYDGNIVAEKYAPGVLDKNTMMLGWSMSKSLTAAMIGILVKENKLSIDAPAPVPAWINTKNKRSHSNICCSKQQVLTLRRSIQDQAVSLKCYLAKAIWLLMLNLCL